MAEKKRPWQYDDENSRAKRRLIDSLKGLSLDPEPSLLPPKINVESVDTDEPEMMDFGGTDTVFIPSIDEFLEDEPEKSVFKSGLERLIKIPQSVLRRSNNLLLHERPSHALIKYEPKEVVIWRHLIRYTTDKSRHVSGPVDMDMDMDVDVDRAANMDPVDEDIVLDAIDGMTRIGAEGPAINDQDDGDVMDID